MNDIDPAGRFSRNTVRSFNNGGDYISPSHPLNDAARAAASKLRHDTMSPVMVSGVLRLVEFAVVCLSGFLLFAIIVGSETNLTWHYPLLIIGVAFSVVMLMELMDCYQLPSLMRPLPVAGRILLVWSGAFAVMALLGFPLGLSQEFSSIWFLTWYLTGLILLIAICCTLAMLARSWARSGAMERRAVIVGGGAAAEGLIKAIEEQPYNDIRICGIFDDRGDRRSPPVVAGYPKLGKIAELIEFARIAHIDMLIICLPITAEDRVLSLLKKLWVLPVDIRLSAHSNQLKFRPRAYSYIGSVPMLDIFDKPINNWDSVVKRAFDIVFSLLGILVFSPIMLATAIAIKLDSKGPILFKQKRLGFNNKTIDVYKFRSMYMDMHDPSARNAVKKGDPRVTRVGRWIRKLSIDELPQFFNALFGSLSLVGPRPHAFTALSENKLYHEVVDGYFARHRVKPGVTGWAQVNGWRGETDRHDKIRMRTEFDLYYIENWSLWFDLKILFLTPISLLDVKNAY